jgi:hypothetical protein
MRPLPDSMLIALLLVFRADAGETFTGAADLAVGGSRFRETEIPAEVICGFIHPTEFDPLRPSEELGETATLLLFAVAASAAVGPSDPNAIFDNEAGP